MLLLITVSSCTVKKKILEQSKIETVRIDTVFHTITVTETEYRDKIIKIIEPMQSSFTIKNPCDSTGHLNEVNYRTKIGNLEIIISSLEGELSIQIDKDSLVSSIEKEYIFKQKNDSINVAKIYTEKVEHLREETKYRLSRLGWFSIGLNIILILVLSLLLLKKIRNPFNW